MDKDPLEDAGLGPVDTLANRCAQWAIGGGYRTWVPRWSAEAYAEETRRIAQILRESGITDELLTELEPA